MTKLEDLDQLRRIVMKTVVKMLKEDLDPKPMKIPKGHEGSTIIIKESSSNALFLLLHLLDKEKSEMEVTHGTVSSNEVDEISKQIARLNELNEKMYNEIIKIKSNHSG